MKTKQKLPIADCRFLIGKKRTVVFSDSIVNSDKSRARDGGRCRKSQIVNARAFTLVELLIVIAVIAVLAALIFPVVGAVKRQSFIRAAQGELAQLQTAIERYKSAYGFYPPTGVNGPLTNELFFELAGTTNNAGEFQTLDGSAQISVADANSTFGTSGFMNCNKPGGDESTARAQNFLPGLKPRQIATLYTNGNDSVNILVASAGGPDPTYRPLNMQNVNPWRYNSSNPTNNPGSYDLWVQLVIAGKSNLICNWDKQVQINSPWP